MKNPSNFFRTWKIAQDISDVNGKDTCLLRCPTNVVFFFTALSTRWSGRRSLRLDGGRVKRSFDMIPLILISFGTGKISF
jgi:hypothetical protein